VRTERCCGPVAKPVQCIAFKTGGKGTPPFCEPVSVEESSWGTIKGLYR